MLMSQRGITIMVKQVRVPVDSVHLVIEGVPRVKKNNQHVTWRGGRPIKVNTAAYGTWLARAEVEIFEQIMESYSGLQPITEAVNLRCRFFMDTARRVDLSALYEGIQDVLVKLGVLDDDNYNIVASHDGSGVEIDRERPRMEITITPKETI